MHDISDLGSNEIKIISNKTIKRWDEVTNNKT